MEQQQNKFKRAKKPKVLYLEYFLPFSLMSGSHFQQETEAFKSIHVILKDTSFFFPLTKTVILPHRTRVPQSVCLCFV